MQNLKSIGENHEPVLLKESLEALKVNKLAHSKKAKFIDSTLGLGGHTKAIVESGGQVLGIEQDMKSLEVAKTRLEAARPPKYRDVLGSFTLAHGNFKDIEKIARENNFQDVDGIIFDLGISSYQLEKKRGFSYRDIDALLDLRMDPDSQAVTGTDLLNVLNEGQLKEMFSEVLPFFESKILSERVVESRKIKKIDTVGDFLDIISKLPGSKKSLNPATLPFLSLRVKVNSELENLGAGLPQSFKLLKSKGRLVVISFHSKEDAIVKRFFIEKKEQGLAEIITDKPVIPGSEEIARNSRSRSAKMRVLEKK